VSTLTLRYRKDSAAPKGQFVYNQGNVTPEQVIRIVNQLEQSAKIEKANRQELEDRIKDLEMDKELLKAAITISENSLNNALKRISKA